VKYKFILVFIFSILALGYIVPEPRVIPVLEASQQDWHKESFWFEPWGVSGTHKGIDIFGDMGKPVVASSHLLILYLGQLDMGGNVIVGLGPKWRIHYFAHLQSATVEIGRFVKAGDVIGSVGDSGNAKGKPPHLHFSIISLVPLVWMIDSDSQGYKKAFYLNPNNYLLNKN